MDLKRPNKPPATASLGHSWYTYQEKESFPQLVGSRRTSKVYLSISEMLSSANCIIVAAGNVSQATSPILQLLKVRDTSGFLPSDLLQFAGFLHARRDAQGFLPTSVFPALAFTASLCHVSMHKDAVSSPLLRPGSRPSLKDTYFHIQVVQRHRKFLRFAFGGKGYQYKVLPFWLALAPRMFTKCMDAALAPLRLQGIQILNYLDNWLFLGSSREQVIRHRDSLLVLSSLPFFWESAWTQPWCRPVWPLLG